MVCISVAYLHPAHHAAAASVPGNALTGYLSDRVPVRFAILVSCVLAAVACLVLWGLGASDGLLVAFSLVWGVSSLSFSGVWSKMISVICREWNVKFLRPRVTHLYPGDDPTAPALVFSSFSMLKGIGNLTSGMFAERTGISRRLTWTFQVLSQLHYSNLML
jgi:predicted MFS family arabinose efflux permease